MGGLLVLNGLGMGSFAGIEMFFKELNRGNERFLGIFMKNSFILGIRMFWFVL